MHDLLIIIEAHALFIYKMEYSIIMFAKKESKPNLTDQ